MVKCCLHADSSQPFTVAHQLRSEPTSSFKPFSGALPRLLEFVGATLKHASGPVKAVLLSNVLGPDFESAVRCLCQQHGLPLHVLVVNAREQVQSAYANPASLGKDRWAACLAVSQISTNTVNLIVSFGTATTLDALVNTGKWQHLGGFIVPGVQTMLDSLHINTAELPKAGLGQAKESGFWPVNTHQAIGQGVSTTQTALVQSLVAELAEQFKQKPAVWLSGGFAQAMAGFLPGAQVLEHVVFRGLVFDYLMTRQDSA